MKKIIGENLREFFKNAKIQGLRAHSGRIGDQSRFEVWEVQERDYERMHKMTDVDYNQLAPKNSWWKSADGGSMGTFNTDVITNDVLSTLFKKHGGAYENN